MLTPPMGLSPVALRQILDSDQSRCLELHVCVCSWVILSIIWALVSAVISTFLPLWESRDVFMRAAGLAPAKIGNALPTTASGKQSQFKMSRADDSAHQHASNGAKA